jgi:hypothetical protein
LEVYAEKDDTMYRSMLAPLDGSSFGEHALPLALEMARLSNAALCLVHAHEADQRPPDTQPLAMSHERAYLASIADRLWVDDLRDTGCGSRGKDHTILYCTKDAIGGVVG